MIRSKARRSRLEALDGAEEAARIGAIIAVGITMRGRAVLLPMVEPDAVIKRAAGRLDEDWPNVIVDAAMIKMKDEAQSREKERAERSAITRGNRILLIGGTFFLAEACRAVRKL
ncbi:MAG TPA: hypothetical protein VE842_01550 [Pyrinomonadaceae bacterium]|nr:hypothetical protein [Pyrinomonadaceae bacterium]